MSNNKFIAADEGHKLIISWPRHSYSSVHRADDLQRNDSCSTDAYTALIHASVRYFSVGRKLHERINARDRDFEMHVARDTWIQLSKTRVHGLQRHT